MADRRPPEGTSTRLTRVTPTTMPDTDDPSRTARSPLAVGVLGGARTLLVRLAIIGLVGTRRR
jgi:hypothetical protein